MLSLRPLVLFLPEVDYLYMNPRIDDLNKLIRGLPKHVLIAVQLEPIAVLKDSGEFGCSGCSRLSRPFNDLNVRQDMSTMCYQVSRPGHASV